VTFFHKRSSSYVFSCLALNGHAIHGPRLSGHLLDTGDPRAWRPRAQPHAKLGHKEELDRADRW
jgi:hypothetical protein